MGSAAPKLRLLLVDGDDRLIDDVSAVSHPGVTVVCVADLAAARTSLARTNFDAVAVNVGLPGAFEAVGRLTAECEDMLVLALAERGVGGMTLEHTLTVAELRGCALGLPKPIDASELVIAAIEQLARRRTDSSLRVLRLQFEQTSKAC